MFGARLRLSRENKRLTQQNMGDHLGITAVGYAKYEKGTSEPSLSSLVKICEKLEVSADWLLGITTKPVSETEADVLQILLAMRDAGVAVSDALFPDDDKSASAGYLDRGIIAVYISENLSSTFNTLQILENNVKQATHETDRNRLQQNVDNYIKGQIEFLKDKPVQKSTDRTLASKVGLEYRNSLLYAKYEELLNDEEN